MELKPGWLARVMDENEIDIATWPAYMREEMEGGWSDDRLSLKQRKEAARRLRERANELDPEDEAQSAVFEARAIAAEQKVELAVELATELRDRITAWIEALDVSLKRGAR